MALEAPATFCSARRRDWSSMAEPDAPLVECFDQTFRRGVNGNAGPRLPAAFSLVMPIPFNAVLQGLPLAKRCAIAWARWAPTHTRLPLLRCACLAFAGVPASWGLARMAIWVVVSLE